MKRFAVGVLLGAILTASSFLLVGAKVAEQDSISVYLQRLESLIREEMAKNIESGRYQLQSFSIDRTHWHYMLDTTNGELYRLIQGRTPERSEWVLMANQLGDKQSD